MKATPVSKPTLIVLLVAVLAIIGFVIYSHRGKAVVPEQVSETQTIPTPSEWPSTKVKDETINDKGSYYSISAVYPVAKDDVITGYFRSFVQGSIAEFKNDTSWAAGDGANVAPAEADSLSLTIKYSEQKTANADNYTFSTDTYTGGAHDLESTKTFSFSPTGQRITVASLFSNGDDGLNTIATYVRKQLKSTLPAADQSFIEDGTAPTEDNYQSFIVLPDGIMFIFDPYQVAPYSDGQQKVKVPLSVFKGIASSDTFSIR